MLEIAVDAEMSFRIKVPDERLADIKTVSDAVRVIAEFLPTAAPA
jgi:acyl carrier protein